MAILSIFGKEENKGDEKLINNVPFKLATEWFPYKLYSSRKSYVTLTMKISNITKEPLLTSVTLKLPNQIAFDETGISHEKNFRLGSLEPNEEKELHVNVYNNLKAEPGDYTTILIATAHYKDYDHVINSIRKKELISVV